MRVVDEATRLAREPRRRWLAYGVMAIILLILCVVPRQHIARGKIVPDGTSSDSLMSVLGALGGRAQSFASLFGDRGTVEVALSIARSQSIADQVIRKESLVGPDEFGSFAKAQRGLIDRVNVYSLTGGMLEVQTRSSDADWALRITRAYLSAINQRLAAYGREQTVRKSRIVNARMRDAIARLSIAEARLNAFRRGNQLPDPQAQLGSQLGIRAGLEGQLQGKLVQLAALRQTAGSDNLELRTLQTEIAALRRQIADATRRPGTQGGLSASGISAISLQYANLQRDYLFAQNLVQVYTRSAEEVAVQEVAAQNGGEPSMVDPPHVDVAFYYNRWALALLGLLALTVFVIEFYGPATGIWRRRSHDVG